MVTYAAAVLLLALNSIPVLAATPAELEEARRLAEIHRQLDDPARRRANEQWQREHAERMAGYQLKIDEANAEMEKLRKEREQRLATPVKESDASMAVWIWAAAVAAAVAAAIASMRAAKGKSRK